MTPNQRDPWEAFLAWCEWDRLAIGREQTAHWPDAALAEFERLGLLRETTPRAELDCPECPDGPAAEVVRFAHPRTGTALAVLACPACGPVEVPPEALRRWNVEWNGLVPLLSAGLGLRGEPKELVPDRVWQLGKGYRRGRPTTLFLGRALHRRDSADLLAPLAHFSSALFLVPKRTPLAPFPYPVLTLDLVCAWNGEALEFDAEFVETQAEPAEAPRPSRPPKKESQRAAVRQRLRKELDAHVAACRDHVQTALDFGKEPTLLPFPAYAELARRCGTSKATVSRCLAEDRELRELCAAARDLYRQFGPAAG